MDYRNNNSLMVITYKKSGPKASQFNYLNAISELFKSGKEKASFKGCIFITVAAVNGIFTQ